MRFPGLQRLVFCLIGGAIVGINSERVFWYWTPSLLGHIEIAAFYAVPFAGALWVIERHASFIPAVPVFAYLVEGVITPVLYEGLPFVPFFPAYFTAWHGLGSLVGFWYLLHRWLVLGRVRPILAASALYGVFWGAWSLTLRLPANYSDPDLVEDLGHAGRLLSAGEFGVYALRFTVLLAVLHWAWGRLGVTEFRPSPWGRRLYAALILAVVLVWTFLVPWALPMFVLYLWLTLRREPAAPSGLLAGLAGPVRPADLLALAPLPLVASASYGLLVYLDPTESQIRALMNLIVWSQAAVGFGVLLLSWSGARLRTHLLTRLGYGRTVAVVQVPG